MAKKIKVKLNALTTAEEIEELRKLAAEAAGVPVTLANAVVDYKGKHVRLEIFFDVTVTKEALKAAGTFINSLVGVDGTIAFPIGGSVQDFEALTVGQEYTQVVLDSGSTDLTLDLLTSIVGVDKTAKWISSADGQAGKGIAITDNLPSPNFDYVYNGATNYVHNYQGVVRMPASVDTWEHIKIGYDLKIGAGTGGTFPVSGGNLNSQIVFVTNSVVVASLAVEEWDNVLNLARIVVASDGVTQEVRADLDFSSYIRIDMEVLAGQYVKVKIGNLAEIVQPMSAAHTVMQSMQMNWIRQDQFSADGTNKTQKPTLVDNLKIEILA